jgi:hypothetical protein
MGKEGPLVTRMIAAVRKKYPRAFVRKLSDRFQRGLPDILIMVPRRVFGGIPECQLLMLAVEAKRPDGGRASALQKVEGKEINALPSAKWMIATSVRDVMDVLEKAGAYEGDVAFGSDTG